MLAATWLSILLFASGPKPPLRAAVVSPACGPIVVTATPATITFNAANPDSPAVAGSAMASVMWQTTGQAHLPWSLTIQADAGSLLNCPAIPASAVLASCSRATINGGGGSAVCSSTAPLSGSPQMVAAGDQTSANAFYQVNLNFTFSDSWKYIAQLSPPCTLSLTYTVNFQ